MSTSLSNVSTPSSVLGTSLPQSSVTHAITTRITTILNGLKGWIPTFSGKLAYDFGACDCREEQPPFNGPFIHDVKGCDCKSTSIKDASHIQDPHFLHLLAQQECDGASAEYPLTIIADFLQKNGFEMVGTQLEEAHRTFVSSLLVTKQALLTNHYKAIHQAIQTLNTPKLLCIDCLNHIVGLRLVQTVPGYIDCEIFNSGYGLRYHAEHPIFSDVLQTRLRIRVPAASLTQDELEKLICDEHCTCEVYKQILTLKGAKVVPASPQSAIWQRAQQSDNCTLMWILVFLRHNMPPQEYYKMLYLLFRDGADAAQKTGAPKSLQHTLAKRRDRLALKSKL